MLICLAIMTYNDTSPMTADFTEFIPYVFQILSLMLEMHETTIPESYAGLYPFLLAPALWERMGNIPPLVRLLRAYVEKGGEQILSKLVRIYHPAVLDLLGMTPFSMFGRRDSVVCGNIRVLSKLKYCRLESLYTYSDMLVLLFY